MVVLKMMKFWKKSRRVKLAVNPAFDARELDEVLLKEGQTQAVTAIFQLIDEQVIDMQHAAGGPDLNDAYTKWLLGGAQALLSLKADIKERVDPLIKR